MEHFELIRRMVYVDGLSQREVARRLGHSRKSIRKALENSSPIPYQLEAPKPRPKLDPFVPLIRTWLTDDTKQPRKQRHTAVRVWERLRDEHQYDGSRRAVSDVVKQIRRELVPPEIFVPIDHPCGAEFQVDWGEVSIELNTVRTKVMIFCVRSAYSKATFVRAYLRDDMLSFLDAHVWLFNHLGGVPRRLAYDNLSTAVSLVLRRGNRKLTGKFRELRSHYLFDTRFCNVAKGNEKGHVENSVKRAERTYLTPMPKVTSIEALNDHLASECEKDLARICNTTHRSYGDLLDQERPTLLPLPPVPLAAAQSHCQKVDRQSTVTCGQARYSVPTKYACLMVLVRSYYDRVEVIHQETVIASHQRVEAGNWSLEMEHYLSVLERKPGLLDSGIPFKTSCWSDSEQLLRRELEYRLGEEGTRQFLAIVLLSKEYPWRLVQEAIRLCVRRRAFHEQAVRMELQRLIQGPSQEPSAAILDLCASPLLQGNNSGTRDLSIYDALLTDAEIGENQHTIRTTVTDYRSITPLPVHVEAECVIESLTLARSATDEEENHRQETDEQSRPQRLGPQCLGVPTAVTASADDAC